jgi:hypothetical protein
MINRIILVEERIYLSQKLKKKRSFANIIILKLQNIKEMRIF